MNLIYRGKRTLAFKKLTESSDPTGTVAERMRSNYPSDDHKVLQTLLKHKYVETKSSGPKGGSRYHITTLGAQALDAAIDKLLNSQVAA